MSTQDGTQRVLWWILSILLVAYTLGIGVWGTIYATSNLARPFLEDPFIGQHPIEAQVDEIKAHTETSDLVRILFRFRDEEGTPRKIAREDLYTLTTLYWSLVDSFPQMKAVVGLNEFPRFLLDEDAIGAEPVFSEQSPDTPEEIDEAALYARIQESLALGRVVEKDLESAYFVLAFPTEYDEEGLARRLIEWGRGASIPEVTWQLFTKDTAPADTRIGFTSYAISRTLFKQAFQSDSLLRVSPALFVAAMLLLMAFFGSLRHALVGLGAVVASFLWTRGAVVWVAWLGIPASSHIYTTIVDVVSFLLVLSFVIHVAESSKPDAAISARNTRRIIVAATITSIASMIGNLLWGPMAFWTETHTPRIIFEVGVMSIVAALHALGAGLVVRKIFALPSFQSRISENEKTPWLRRLLERLVAWLATYRVRPVVGLVVLGANVALALWFVLTGKLQYGSDPSEYLGNTHAAENIRYVNAAGRSCYSDLHMFVLADTSIWGAEPVSSPAFVAYADSVQQVLDAQNGDCAVMGLPGQEMADISLKRFGRLPVSAPELAYVYRRMDGVPEQFRTMKDEMVGPNWFRLIVQVADVSWDPKDPASQGSMITTGRRLTQAGTDRGLAVKEGNRTAIYSYFDVAVYTGWIPNLLFNMILIGGTVWAFITISSRWSPAVVLIVPWRMGLLATVPLLFARAFLTNFMVLADNPMDMATAVISELAVSASMDFTIYHFFAFVLVLPGARTAQQAVGRALLLEGAVILIDAVANATNYTPLLVSSFLPMVDLGGYLVLMLLVLAFSLLVLVTPLLPWAVRKDVFAPFADELRESRYQTAS